MDRISVISQSSAATGAWWRISGGNPFSYTWSDGTPNVTGSTATGVYISGASRGFQITVPADTTPRILTIYVGVYATQGRLVAHPSDSSAADYVDTSLSSGASVPRAYTFNYQAASAGQTLTVTFTNVGSGGNVNLQAAYLAQQDFTISASPSSNTVTAGNSTSYTVTTTALNGFTGAISLAVSGLPYGATASFSYCNHRRRHKHNDGYHDRTDSRRHVLVGDRRNERCKDL